MFFIVTLKVGNLQTFSIHFEYDGCEHRGVSRVGLVERSLSASNSIFLQPASARSNLRNPSWIFASPPLLPEADGGKMLWAVIASKYAALESETFTLEKLSDAEASRCHREL